VTQELDNEHVAGLAALYVATSLRHPLSDSQSLSFFWSSTIEVLQYKSKFGQTCVYCKLAETNLVNEMWAAQGHDGEPSIEFRALRHACDAAIYRNSYLGFVSLVPEHRDIIIDRADYAYLLYDSIEQVDEWIAGLHANAASHVNHKAHLDRLLLEWNVTNTGQLRKKLAGVCMFKDVKQR